MSMKSAVTSALLRLPPGMRILVVVFSGAGLLVGVSFLAMYIREKTNLPGWFWVFAGIILVALVAAIVSIAKFVKKRKVKQADDAIREGAAGGSGSVSDPDEIARLDQLRKDFLTSYSRFREHNEEGVYSLPFLMLVGEPGSGKTEAIRHSNINFPSGLNKPSQGAGGTYNMDWWFTNDAIILDTAGRLMFEETDEWNELLRQLNRVRPHCPINGLLLVIPADSLLKDSAEQIEEKADRIAQQINIIKRELGIRFPVFVVISKCDLITGFREFFTHLNDPVLQHQILGWSNPSDLDEPFKPELVDRHLEQVQERLRRRRLSQLFDPPEIDYSGRRADQVDALYAFPEEFMQIKSRLQLYMEKIFTPGPWTKKPPFVRGIYFTSSMQEGQEIDTALAEMLGVEAGELPGGRTWQKDKAYFLKDLFLQKIFPEQGLVSRASNAVKNYQRNKTLVQVTGTCAIVLSAALFIWTWLDFRSTIGTRSNWWQQINYTIQDDNLPRAVVRGDGGLAYQDTEFRVDGDPYTPARFLRKSADEAAHPIEPRNLMRIVAFFADPFRGYPTEEARDAHSRLVEYMLLQPLVDDTRAKLRDEGEWAPGTNDGNGVSAATRALAEIIRLEAIDQGTGSIGELQVDALLAYTLKPDAQPDEREVVRLQHALAAMQPWGRSQQLAARLGAGEDGANRSVIETAMAAHESFWHEQLGSLAGGPFEQITRVETLANQFDRDEQRLLELARGGFTIEQWHDAYQRIDKAGTELTESVERNEVISLAIAYDEAIASVTASCESAYDLLRAAKGMRHGDNDESADAENGSESAPLNNDIADRLRYGCEPREIDSEQRDRWRQIDQRLLATAGEADQRAFQQRHASYQSVNHLFLMARDGDASYELGTFEQALSRIHEADREVVSPTIDDGMPEALRDRQRQASELVTTAASRARDDRRQELYASALRAYATTEIARYVEQRATPLEIPLVPLSRAAVRAARAANDDRDQHFRDRYHPDAARAIFSDWKAIETGNEDEGTAISPDWPNAEREVRKYKSDYRTYWKEDVCDLVRVAEVDYPNWSSFYEAISSSGAQRSAVARAIEDFARVRARALRVLGDEVDVPELDSSMLERMSDEYQDYRRNVASLDGRDGIHVVNYFARIDHSIDLEPYEMYLGDSAEGDCIVAGYFRSVQVAKFGVLAREAEGPIRKAIEVFERSDRQRFPVVWDPRGEQELSLSALGELATAAEHLAGRREARGGNAPTLGIPEIDEHLAAIRGEGGAVRPDDRDVIRAIRMISRVFGNDEMTITILGWNGRDLDRGDARSAVDEFQEFSIHQADRELLHRRTGDSPGSSGIERTLHPQAPLEFKFNNLGESPQPVGDRHNWTLARMLQNGGKPLERSGSRDDGFDTWHLPVRGSADDRDLIFWITVKFESPLPHPDDWPKSRTWPRF